MHLKTGISIYVFFGFGVACLGQDTSLTLAYRENRIVVRPVEYQEFVYEQVRIAPERKIDDTLKIDNACFLDYTVEKWIAIHGRDTLPEPIFYELCGFPEIARKYRLRLDTLRHHRNISWSVLLSSLAVVTYGGVANKLWFLPLGFTGALVSGGVLESSVNRAKGNFIDYFSAKHYYAKKFNLELHRNIYQDYPDSLNADNSALDSLETHKSIILDKRKRTPRHDRNESWD